jgi:hypothetical protein
MTKAPSPLLGYNNNVRHKNRVFHIQTEDSGIKRPHIITHLFMDGGRILKSVKTSYAEHVGNDKLGDVVRQMMKEQHKAMFRALRDGEFDAVVDDAIAGNMARNSKAPPPPPPASDPSPLTIREPPPAPESEPQLTVDLDVPIEQPPSPPRFQPQADLPPPPANVLSARGGDPGTGRYRTLEEREERAPPSSRGARKSERPPRTERTEPKTKSERPAARSERPPRSAAPARVVREERVKRSDPRAEPPSEPKQPAASKQSSRPRDANQPAAVRPAAIFGQARPQQSSIFGEDIISDKSLDEVILSYLAEDLEEGSK